MTVAPLLGLQTTVVHSVLANANPLSIALQIFLGSVDFEVNAMIDGPAPLIVTPKAPDAIAFFFTLSKPGIRCFLAGSTIMSSMESPIRLTSFFINPTVMEDAFARFFTWSERAICCGSTLLDNLVFF